MSWKNESNHRVSTGNSKIVQKYRNALGRSRHVDTQLCFHSKTTGVQFKAFISILLVYMCVMRVAIFSQQACMQSDESAPNRTDTQPNVYHVYARYDLTNIRSQP